MNAPRVFFYVQHLWGVGHVYRATRIAKYLSAAGLDVHLIWGGTQIPGFDFSDLTMHALKPVRTSDASFSQLLHADGTTFEDADKEERSADLLALFDRLQPDIVITEAFPFGRRQMRFELLPLLAKAKTAPKPVMIVASIRDIMQENRKVARVEESNALVENYFDLIMVHGDPGLIRIEQTLQGVESFADKIRYTGLVTPEPVEPDHTKNHASDVLVSVGGGAFGQHLLETALQAAAQAQEKGWRWLVTTGTELSSSSYEAIVEAAPAGVKIVRHLPDLRSAMQSTRVSVSHAGYNTVSDVLRAGCNCVLYPYTGGRETEQLRRAMMMEKLGVGTMIEPDSLSPAVLLEAINQSMTSGVKAHGLDLEGAKNAASILKSEFQSFSTACA